MRAAKLGSDDRLHVTLVTASGFTMGRGIAARSLDPVDGRALLGRDWLAPDDTRLSTAAFDLTPTRPGWTVTTWQCGSVLDLVATDGSRQAINGPADSHTRDLMRQGRMPVTTLAIPTKGTTQLTLHAAAGTVTLATSTRVLDQRHGVVPAPVGTTDSTDAPTPNAYLFATPEEADAAALVFAPIVTCPDMTDQTVTTTAAAKVCGISRQAVDKRLGKLRARMVAHDPITLAGVVHNDAPRLGRFLKDRRTLHASDRAWTLTAHMADGTVRLVDVAAVLTSDHA